MRLPLIHIHVYICKRGGDVNGTRFSLYAWCVWMCICVNVFIDFSNVILFMCYGVVLVIEFDTTQFISVQFSSMECYLCMALGMEMRKKKCWNFGSQLIDKLRFFNNFCPFLSFNIGLCSCSTNITPTAIKHLYGPIRLHSIYFICIFRAFSKYTSNKCGLLFPIVSLATSRPFFLFFNI